MLSPLYNNPRSANLPSEDKFHKTNRIFNDLFSKNIQLQNGTISKTNINGIIWVNFLQVAIRSIIGYSDDTLMLSCGHIFISPNDKPVGREQHCYYCGMMSSYRNFEHEWSHIIFKSSPAMFDRFLQIYANHYNAYEIIDLLSLVVNAFDDLRVNSLWNIVYPGSAGEIERRWKELNDEDLNINTNFITWLFGVALRSTRLGDGPFYDLIPIAQTAVEAVKGRGAANMLRVVRWFLEQCIDRLRKPPSERPKESKQEKEQNEGSSTGKNNPSDDTSQAQELSRDEAVQKLRSNLRDFRREQEHHQIDRSDYVSKIAYKITKTEEEQISQIMRPNLEDLKKEEIPLFQPDGLKRPIDGDMEEAIKSLQQSNNDSITETQYLLTDEPDKILIAEVLPEQILKESKIEIPPEQQIDIDRMRAVFAKFIGKKISRLIDDGEEIDVQALIRYRLDGQDDEIFEDDALTKGFAYLTLCDMSHSMSGEPFDYVCLGSEMLKQALDYPFVKSHLWGFRGAIGAGSVNYVTAREKILAATKGGEVWIYKYHKDCDGYLASAVEGCNKHRKETIPVQCGGTTPTNIGIRVATKYLSSAVSAGMEKRIFLLTDGNPTQYELNGTQTEHLMRSVKEEIIAARGKGIKVYTTILGDEITDNDALEMFGSPLFWRRVPVNRVGQALLDMVVTQFVQFIRG